MEIRLIIAKAFDKKLYCCVNDKDVYALELIPEREEKSKNIDLDYQAPKPAKTVIPAMNHPWRRITFGKFVKQQKYHLHDESA